MKKCHIYLLIIFILSCGKIYKVPNLGSSSLFLSKKNGIFIKQFEVVNYNSLLIGDSWLEKYAELNGENVIFVDTNRYMLSVEVKNNLLNDILVTSNIQTEYHNFSYYGITNNRFFFVFNDLPNIQDSIIIRLYSSNNKNEETIKLLLK